MRPNRLILIVAEQTAGVRHNPGDEGYVAARVKAMKETAWALWEARLELQHRRAEETPASVRSKP
jgi:hypothetical protein